MDINIQESFLSLAKSIKNKQEGVDENAEVCAFIYKIFIIL
jgi:hypothetical protein